MGGDEYVSVARAWTAGNDANTESNRKGKPRKSAHGTEKNKSRSCQAGLERYLSWGRSGGEMARVLATPI